MSTNVFARFISAVASLFGKKSTTPTVNVLKERDIQLEQQVRQLTSQQSQAQAILDSMVEGVCALDRDGRVLSMNRSAERLFGVSSQQAIGRRLIELFRQPEVEGAVREALERQQPCLREVQVFAPQERTIRFQAAPCEGGDTGATLVIVAQDVTQVRRLEGMRREFVANVSHELKTPLTSIRSLTETLLEGALSDPTSNRRFVQLIDEDATRLSRLIDDLLSLSQIESQAVPLQRSPVVLKPLVESVAVSLQPAITHRRLTLTLQLPPGLTVHADPDRLRQVVANLLENAIKYNRDSGTITVSATTEQAMAHVTVTDTGIGIPPADLPRVFERFYRVDKARSRELGGTGLGLSIVKHIVEAHGGSVSVQSQPDRGSSFSFTIPLAS